MKPFEFVEARDEQDAVRLLEEHGLGAGVIAGGQTLLLALKDRSKRPAVLVSVAKIESMRGIRLDDDGDLVVGAATTYATLSRAELAGWHAEIARVAGDLADRPVRTMGTIGGAICAADPRFDMPTLAVGTDARLELLSPRGYRVLDTADFFVSGGGTVLQPDELLVAVRFPSVDRFSGVAFEKFRQRTFDAAQTSAVCALKVTDGQIADARIAVGAATPTPRLCPSAVEELRGRSIRDGSGVPASTIAANAAADALPEATTAADRYRRELAETLTRRALVRALTATRS